uniref:Uncharacterized protein n=1 Tax=Rhizophora mucronata TaxID=61149 RepID=A0A2P2NQR3_RHIMU
MKTRTTLIYQMQYEMITWLDHLARKY